jgi:chromosome segregation ATPase
MGGTIARELSEDLFAKAYRSQLGIQFLVKECELKDATLRKLESEIAELRSRARFLEEDNAQLKKAILSVQQLQSETQELEVSVNTLDCVLNAVIKSLRPLGLDKKKFSREMINISRHVPNDGTQASRHLLLHTAATKVLKRKI